MERPFVHTGVGFEAQLICIVHAEPQPHVIWYKETTQLGTTEQHSQQVRNENKKKNKYIHVIRFHDFVSAAHLIVMPFLVVVRLFTESRQSSHIDHTQCHVQRFRKLYMSGIEHMGQRSSIFDIEWYTNGVHIWIGKSSSVADAAAAAAAAIHRYLNYDSETLMRIKLIFIPISFGERVDLQAEWSVRQIVVYCWMWTSNLEI